MKIIGLSGSLRSGSLNTHLLKSIMHYVPGNSEFEILSLDLPLYSEDHDGDETPQSIIEFKKKIKDADALIIASPEYNHSFSGVLKNGLDWVSRPAFNSPMMNKPVAILTASMSPVGGVRAQAQLRVVLASMLCEVYPGREFSVPTAHRVFSSEGVLHDEVTAQRLKRFVEEFLNWMQVRFKM